MAEIQDEDKDNRDEPKNVQGKVVASCNKILPEGNVHLFTLFVICLYFK